MDWKSSPFEIFAPVIGVSKLSIRTVRETLQLITSQLWVMIILLEIT
ncbi:hypothetical protein LINPERHAP2_LOCUS4596 [Linum perenne]